MYGNKKMNMGKCPFNGMKKSKMQKNKKEYEEKDMAEDIVERILGEDD